MKLTIAALATLAVLASPIAQAQTYGENVDVNVVLIDAVVTDPQGNQILGLSKDDFVVKENGREIPVESLDYFTNRQLLDGKEETAPFKVERVHEERYFILFFDKPPSGVLWDQLALARANAATFIQERMREGDQVAIVGHDVRLKVYSDFTNNKTQLESALDDVGRFGNGITKPVNDVASASILRRIDLKKMINKTGTVYQAIDLLADATRGIRARKNLVLISPGIHEPGEEVRNGVLLNRSRYYQPMIESLNTANVAVYGINLRKDQANDPAIHQTLDNMSTDTGGEYFRQVVTFTPILSKIDRTNAGYYLLTYRTSRGKGESGFQNVDVTVKSADLRVKARPGYSYGEIR
jgi:VWFA-related protein